MRPTVSDSQQGYGVVLVRGNAAASARWIRRGLVAVQMVPLEGWTAVCLAEKHSRAKAPYDVGLEVLAARRVPVRYRPSMGFFVIDGCAIITVQPRGWRPDQRWLVWEPGAGVRQTPELHPLPAALIAQVAGVRDRGVADAIRHHFADPSGDPLTKLLDVIAMLGLPGAQLLTSGADDSFERIEPNPRSVAAFDVLAAEEGALRAESDR